ncbi:hypothetical protein MSIMFB_05723 [Mycobacterium simulans]|uniref:Uncharacterized protein n=1 Tax=Mycobacterium simulans TaxID=627089 RepID=A0A7Z7ITG9_9MYCO|nr:hypothetical protein [Mycobacterium simulans]SOK27502.1 hypothetical protein MSIMFB_05723 [Mycobacterium simulans]
MSGGDQQLKIILDQLAALLGLPPPPPLTPAQVANPGSVIDNLLAVLGAATNVGIPGDIEAGQAGQAEREAKLNEALAKFPANEDQSAAQLAAVGNQGEMAQMLQQMPQMASGVAGGIAGALGGALQPLSQIPQQVAQAGQQAMQMGMGLLQHGAETGETTPGELLGAESEFGGGGGGRGLAGTAGGAGGGIDTTPTAMLGPPPTPSAGTVPTSSHVTSPAPTAAPEASTASRGAMGAMPMMPPGAMHGTGGPSDAKPETKRIVAPSVKNGAPVQGRISTPPPLPPAVTKHVEGKPVVTRRILLPTEKGDDNSASNR